MNVSAAFVGLGSVLLLGCSESTAPAAGQFQARLSGAGAAILAGASNARSFFTEADPDGARFGINMFAGANDTLRSISISCPGEEPPAPGTYPLSTGPEGCRGGYVRLTSTQSAGTVILEQASSSSGSVTITASSDAEVAGRFGFEGELVVGTEPAGTVSVSGAFNATNLD